MNSRNRISDVRISLPNYTYNISCQFRQGNQSLGNACSCMQILVHIYILNTGESVATSNVIACEHMDTPTGELRLHDLCGHSFYRNTNPKSALRDFIGFPILI